MIINSTTKSLLFLTIFLPAIIIAQDDINASIDDTHETKFIQPRRLVDAHTAGILPQAYFDFETRIYPSGSDSIWGSGLLMALSVGLTDRLNIGISYGGDGIIGRGGVNWNPYPGALIKYRIIEESFILPAIAFGYDHQGWGGVESNYTGFVYKSQGIFIALSKNYLVFKKLQLGIHGSVNFSFEDIRDVKWPNAFLGMDFGLNEELAIALEYDLALNQRDWHDEGYTNPLRGFLSISIRWAFSKAFYLEFDAKDITQMKLDDELLGTTKGWSRELKLVYLTSFFKK